MAMPTNEKTVMTNAFCKLNVSQPKGQPSMREARFKISKYCLAFTVRLFSGGSVKKINVCKTGGSTL